MSRKIDAADIFKELVAAVGRIYCQADPKVTARLSEIAGSEPGPLAKDILQSIVHNSEIALKDGLPTCQDTGTVVLFMDVGERVSIVNGELDSTINQALELAWNRYSLRRSMVEEPLFKRTIISNKVPPVIHWEITPGNQLRVLVGLKGGGAENMSSVKMMPVSSTPEDIKQAVIDTVVKAGGKACPPVIVGVGLGGNIESCALMAKRALFEELGREHHDPRYAQLEKDILDGINRWGRGVMGMGEGPSALAVHVRTAPCHIASMPLAVNLDCHAHRHTGFVL